MSYSEIDPILSRWAARRNLQVLTEYRDVEVRTFEVVDRGGARFQLWIDPPEGTGKVKVHLWDYGTRRRDYEVRPDRLLECLDSALKVVSRWVSPPS